jgi:hypothetical protein
VQQDKAKHDKEPVDLNVVSAGEHALGALIEAAHLAAAHELPALISKHAAILDARDAVAYLADLQQLVLVPFTGPAGPGTERHLEPLVIDSTVAGRAFQHVEVTTHGSAAGGGTRACWASRSATERRRTWARDCWGCGCAVSPRSSPSS